MSLFKEVELDDRDPTFNPSPSEPLASLPLKPLFLTEASPLGEFPKNSVVRTLGLNLPSMSGVRSPRLFKAPESKVTRRGGGFLSCMTGFRTDSVANTTLSPGVNGVDGVR